MHHTSKSVFFKYRYIYTSETTKNYRARCRALDVIYWYPLFFHTISTRVPDIINGQLDTTFEAEDPR